MKWTIRGIGAFVIAVIVWVVVAVLKAEGLWPI